jgi:signal peptidase I
MSNRPLNVMPCRRLCATAPAITAAVLMHLLPLQPAYADGFPLGFRLYNIPAGSMKPTLLVGDYAFAISASEAKRGDVVTYRLPRDPSTTYVKRIVGLGGDRIQMVDGAL